MREDGAGLGLKCFTSKVFYLDSDFVKTQILYSSLGCFHIYALFKMILTHRMSGLFVYYPVADPEGVQAGRSTPLSAPTPFSNIL